MMKTLMTSLFFLLSLNALAEKPGACSGYLQAYLLWNDKIDGKVVEKHSVFPLVDWDPDSQYHGVILMTPSADKLKSPLLEIEYISKNKAISKKQNFTEVTSLAQDKSLKTFNFDPEEFFKFDRPGHYVVRLKNENKLICEEKFKYGIGH